MGKQSTLSPTVYYILSIISGGPLKMGDCRVCPVPEFSFSLGSREAWSLSQARKTAGASPLAASWREEELSCSPRQPCRPRRLLFTVSLELLAPGSAVDGEGGRIILPGCLLSQSAWMFWFSHYQHAQWMFLWLCKTTFVTWAVFST